jgi:hypothetical protein
MGRGLVCKRPIEQTPEVAAEVEHPVPLVAVSVFTTIHDLAVETTIEQMYCNTEQEALEVE